MTLTWIMYFGDLIASIGSFLVIGIIINATISIVCFMAMLADFSPSKETQKKRLIGGIIALIIFIVFLLGACFVPSKETVRVAQIEYIATQTPASKLVYRVAKWLDSAILPDYAEKKF